MPPPSPLPRRGGLDASWLRTPDNVRGMPCRHATMRDFLRGRLPEAVPVDEFLAAGRFVDARGHPWDGREPFRANTFVWFHRDRRPEPAVPFPLEVLDVDERVVVVDKPHFLASIPRGSHVTESVVVKLRERLGLDELAPAHRLDRLTAGVLILTTERRWRGTYANLFAAGAVHKSYEAIAPLGVALDLPRTLSGRIVKRRGRLQAELVEGEPNARTTVELLEARDGYGRYLLTPSTGKTHQLRVQLAALGIPIVCDPLYPAVRDVAPDDFSGPLQLVARRLRFTDPVDGLERDYTSRVSLSWPHSRPEEG